MPLEDDLLGYAGAFAVSIEWLASGQVLREEDARAAAELETHSPKAALARARRESAARLALARRLAGFRSPTQAWLTYGWNKASYLSNENGHGGLSTHSALRYADAFGVNPGWLLTGEPPSGLGGEVDALGPEPVWSEALAGLVDPDRRGPVPPKADLERAATRPAIPRVIGPEYSGLLRRLGGVHADKVIEMLVAIGTSVVDPECFEVVTPVPGSRAGAGDIVVVDRYGPASALYAINDHGGLRLVADPAAPSGGDRSEAGFPEVVGRVIARIERT